MPIDTEVTITEIEEFEPSRVDGVGKGANGFPILMLKQLGGDAEKADDSPPCKTCDGSGKIMEGNRKCPDCFGTGKAPKVGESVKAFAERVTKEDRDERGRFASGGGSSSGSDTPKADAARAMTERAYSTGDVNDHAAAAEMHAEATREAVKNGDMAAAAVHAGQADMHDGEIDKVDEAKGHDDPVVQNALERSGHAVNQANALSPATTFTDRTTGRTQTFNKATGVAPSGSGPTPATDCPTCDGTGKIDNKTAHSMDCPDCGGTGKDQSTTNPSDLKAVNADPGRISMGDPDGREAIDKAVDDDASKATADGAVFTAANPALAAPDTSSAGDGSGTDPDDAATPGSPAWEAVDAATATAAALALTNASELIRQFAQRESIEVAAGQGNDTFDAYAATAALSSVSDALGIMAQLAFHEGLEAQKSIGDDDDDDTNVEKAGKRLSGRSVAALAAARDKAKELSTHLTGLLGDDDPAQTNKTKDNSGKSAAAKFIQNANKALLAKEIETMSTDELDAVLDSRDERLVGIIAEALKGKSLDDQTDSVAGAKDANTRSKNKKPKKNNFDLEDEQDAGDDDAGSTDAAKAESDKTEKHAKAKAVKAELTPEEIEAREAKKAARKQLKKAERAEKAAAEYAKVRKAVEEATAEVQKTNAVLTERLEAVEKMAAPGGPVRTRTQDAITKSTERDAIDLEIARYESLAKSTDDRELAQGYREAVKQLRVKLATL